MTRPEATSLRIAFEYLVRGLRAYDVSPDGERFLMLKEIGPTDEGSMPPAQVVVLNWVEELKARVPVD